MSDGYVQRFSQSLAAIVAAGGFVRLNVSADGFKLVSGVVDVEFWRGGRQIGKAEALQEGEGIFGVEFDSLKITPLPLESAPTVTWYVCTGQFVTDRVANTVGTVRSFRAMAATQGYKVALQAATVNVAKRVSFGLVPYVPFSDKVAIVTAIYTSKLCKVAFGSNVGVGLSVASVPASPVQVAYEDATLVTATNLWTPVAGEVNPLVLPGAMWVNGYVQLETPVALYDNVANVGGLFVQADSAGAVGEVLRVGLEWQEGYKA